MSEDEKATGKDEKVSSKETIAEQLRKDAVAKAFQTVAAQPPEEGTNPKKEEKEVQD